MKRWIIRIGIVAVLLAVVLVTAAFWIEGDEPVVTTYVKNDSAVTIKSGFEGVPVDQNGRFVNLEFPFISRVTDLVKWRWEGNPQEEEKKNDVERLPIADPTEFLKGRQDGILWLGHASFFVRLSGKGILLDPVFGDPAFISPYIDVPSPLEDIRKVHYVAISHDHRDHADESSIRQATAKFPEAMLLAGLGSEDILGEWRSGNNPIQTVGWYQKFELPDERVRIYFLPTRHWSRRGLLDMNKRLWGAYVIQSDNTTIYFSGDTGYGSHFKELRELFPKIDYFLIAVGGYKPRWFMEPNHVSPEEALQAFVDSGATALVPMHFGRFDMSDEPPSEPLRLLRERAEEMGIGHKVLSLDILGSTDCGCTK